MVVTVVVVVVVVVVDLGDQPLVVEEALLSSRRPPNTAASTTSTQWFCLTPARRPHLASPPPKMAEVLMASDEWSKGRGAQGQFVNGVLLDLGISSPQLDGGRGFRPELDGPLDMRFDIDPASKVETALEFMLRVDRFELAKVCCQPLVRCSNTSKWETGTHRRTLTVGALLETEGPPVLSLNLNSSTWHAVVRLSPPFLTCV